MIKLIQNSTYTILAVYFSYKSARQYQQDLVFLFFGNYRQHMMTLCVVGFAVKRPQHVYMFHF